MSLVEKEAEKDLKIVSLSRQIKLEEARMLKRLQKINKKKKHNEYLKEIHESYNNFKKDMVNNREKQKKHIKNLIKYLEKMKKEHINNEYLLKKVRNEEEALKKRMSEIKGELKEIKKQTK